MRFRSDVNGFTSDHIERLPDSPTQNGTNSILSFYAILPSGSGSLSKSALATIFTSNQDRILAVESELENPGDSISSDEKPVLTPEQTRNTVPLIIFHILPEKVSLSSDRNVLQINCIHLRLEFVQDIPPNNILLKHGNFLSRHIIHYMGAFSLRILVINNEVITEKQHYCFIYCF